MFNGITVCSAQNGLVGLDLYGPDQCWLARAAPPPRLAASLRRGTAPCLPQQHLKTYLHGAPGVPRQPPVEWHAGIVMALGTRRALPAVRWPALLLPATMARWAMRSASLKRPGNYPGHEGSFLLDRWTTPHAQTARGGGDRASDQGGSRQPLKPLQHGGRRARRRRLLGLKQDRGGWGQAHPSGGQRSAARALGARRAPGPEGLAGKQRRRLLVHARGGALIEQLGVGDHGRRALSQHTCGQEAPQRMLEGRATCHRGSPKVRAHAAGRGRAGAQQRGSQRKLGRGQRAGFVMVQG
jgi:hypothetical protein